MSILASLDNFLSLNTLGIYLFQSLDNFLSIYTLGIYLFQRYGQLLSYGHPPVPSYPDKRGSTVHPR